jgi:rfaE bifunctional protein nucleotidyltransferase chain/domain
VKPLIYDLNRLKELVESLKEAGKRVVFTNGCFDIFHAGHADYLEKAKSFGDYLIVGLNSDSSVRKIKGEKRPIVPEEMRARVLLALQSVDAVFVFDDETPYEVIKVVRPDVLVKGADWPLEKIVGREFAGKVERVSFNYPISTSKIVEKVVERYCSNASRGSTA